MKQSGKEFIIRISDYLLGVQEEDRSRTRTSLLLLLLLLLPISAYYTYMTTRRELTQSILARRESFAELSALLLKEKFDHIINIGLSLATRVKFRQLISQGKWDEARAILKTVPQDFPFVDRILLTDPRGTLMADIPADPEVRGKSFAYRDWYKGVSQEWKP